MKKYKVKIVGELFQVLLITTTFGDRISAYESEPDTTVETVVYVSTPANCYAYIKLKEENYLD